ncbi:MAG: putative S-layer protein [Candidatus Nanoarchaeia archaeon]|nr:putative S-layer protein [Candidatus Nanoarchaeia archaeon]
MKSKIILPLLLTVILSLALVNAADLISVNKGPVFSVSNSQTYFNVNANSNSKLTMSNPVLQINDGKNHYLTVTLDPSSLNSLDMNSGATQRINANVVVDSGFVFDIKTYTFPDITLFAIDPVNSSLNETEKVSLNFLKTFCKYGENGTDLSITDFQVSNNDGDDTEWSPLDEITVDVEVTNEGTEKISSVYVEFGLYDVNGKNIVNNLDDLNNKKIKLGSIDEGDDKKASFTFKVPVDFKEENYKLVVKTYKDENTLCVSQSSALSNTYYEAITGARETDENKQLVVDNIIITPSPAQCGDKVQISGNVVNIGDTDYEDQVKVTLYNKDLGINLEQVIREDFDQGDSSPVDFEFDVPESVKEKSYDLEFRVWYDYDSDDETYSIGSDKIIQPIVIQGNCKTTVTDTANARITAELDSETPEAVAGKQIIINANLKNTGSVETEYTISVSGNTAWSSLVSVTPQKITLAPGDSKDVSIVLTLDPTAEGDKEFTVKAVYGAKTTEQKVALSIVSSGAGSQAFAEHIKANWFIYLIVLVNIILIIAIIVVIRRMLSPKRDEYQ